MTSFMRESPLIVGPLAGTILVGERSSIVFREVIKSGRLPPGISQCIGEFNKGDVVRICDLEGTEFSRGISRYNADEIRARKLKSVEIVHRNDLVIL